MNNDEYKYTNTNILVTQVKPDDIIIKYNHMYFLLHEASPQQDVGRLQTRSGALSANELRSGLHAAALPPCPLAREWETTKT